MMRIHRLSFLEMGRCLVMEVACNLQMGSKTLYRIDQNSLCKGRCRGDNQSVN